MVLPPWLGAILTQTGAFKVPTGRQVRQVEVNVGVGALEPGGGPQALTTGPALQGHAGRASRDGAQVHHGSEQTAEELQVELQGVALGINHSCLHWGQKIRVGAAAWPWEPWSRPRPGLQARPRAPDS